MTRKNNCTTLFLLPAMYHIDIGPRLTITRYTYDKFVNKFFINAYVDDLVTNDTKTVLTSSNLLVGKQPVYIYCAYNIEVSDEFINMENVLMAHPLYRGDYSRNGVAIYIFELPSIYSENYDYFMKGEYSKFTDSYKSEIIKFWVAQPPNSLFYSILFKTSFILDSKISSKLGITKDSKEYYPHPIVANEVLVN